MVNLTSSSGFVMPLLGGLWNMGSETVVVFDSVEEAMKQADQYLKIWHSLPLDANPDGFNWQVFPQTGPLSDCAVRAIGEFSILKGSESRSWKAVVLKLERSSKSPMLTETAFEALRMCIGRTEGKPEYVAQAIALVNALEEESKKGS